MHGYEARSGNEAISSTADVMGYAKMLTNHDIDLTRTNDMYTLVAIYTPYWVTSRLVSLC